MRQHQDYKESYVIRSQKFAFLAFKNHALGRIYSAIALVMMLKHDHRPMSTEARLGAASKHGSDEMQCDLITLQKKIECFLVQDAPYQLTRSLICCLGRSFVSS